jgi:hypothetical protein
VLAGDGKWRVFGQPIYSHPVEEHCFRALGSLDAEG